jgi:IS30 family transposase
MSKYYQHLSSTERAVIQVQLEIGLKPAAIAGGLNRSVSTVSRELRRNGWKRPQSKRGRGRPTVAGGYRAEAADKRAQICAASPRVQRRLRPGTVLWDCVVHYLQISHETIYTAIYAMPLGELRTAVIGWLRFGHNKRRPRSRGEDRRGRIPEMVSIHDRPPEVEERLVPGHWEGDLIKGAYNRSAVGTLVERTTLFTVLAKLDSAAAEATVSGFSQVLNRIEAQKRLWLTYDQGREMAAHRRLTDATGVKVYFTDPHSPWQRGINENTNGLLRQYLPKGSDLSLFTQQELDEIAWSLNTRPRKSLGWKCPVEVFAPGEFDLVEHHHALFALRP